MTTSHLDDGAQPLVSPPVSRAVMRMTPGCVRQGVANRPHALGAAAGIILRVGSTLAVLATLWPAPISAQPAPLPDLDVTYIERLPRYDYDAPQNKPTNGTVVTFRGHIRVLDAPVATASYRWTVDGLTVDSGTLSSLTAGEERIVEYQWTWDSARHVIDLFVDQDGQVNESSERNNSVADVTDAIIVGFWVEQSVYEYFNAHQKDLGIGSNSWEDWAQRQIATWNRMNAEALHPDAPLGVLDRFRLDKVVVVADGALPLNGGLAGNNPDSSDRSVDLMWGFPETLLKMGSYFDTHTATDANPFFYEQSLLHEMARTRYLLDNYGFDVTGSAIGILEGDEPVAGTGWMPYVNADVVYYNQFGGVMIGPWYGWSAYEAAALNLIAGRRASAGNQDPPGNLGIYLQDLPERNHLKLLDRYGTPLAGAKVQLYRASPAADWYGKYFDNVPDLTFTADAEGVVHLPRNPFSGATPIAHTNGNANGVVVLRIKYTPGLWYRFLEAPMFNLEYWRGNHGDAYYTMRLPAADDPPILTVEGFGNPISNGDTTARADNHTDFGAAAPGTGGVTRVFALRNLGEGLVQVQSVQIEGTHAADFEIRSWPGYWIANQGLGTIAIRFRPVGAGPRHARVRITSTDPNDPVYVFAIAGTGVIVPGLQPQVSASVSPATVVAGNSVLLTAAVVPAANPPSTGLSVVANLSAIGVSPTSALYDDGTHGDVTAGDLVFSLLTTVELDTSAGQVTLPVTVTDSQARHGSTTVALNVNWAQGPPPPGDLAEQNASTWEAWAQNGTSSVVDDGDLHVVGNASLRFETNGGLDTYLRYPGVGLANWNFSAITSIRLRVRTYNTNQNQFQGGLLIRLLSPTGTFEWQSDTTALNQTIGEWREFVVPIAGSASWPLKLTGAPTLSTINAIEIHADTYDYGFTLWLDGLQFEGVPGPTYPLNVVTSAPGSGTITSFPGGISCGTDCSESYPADSRVTLTATASPGWVFAGWSGHADCLNGVVTMTGPRNCTANFDRACRLSVVTPPLLFGGSVTTNPPALPGSPATCAPETRCWGWDFVCGTPVTMIQTPESGWTFGGWSGDADCSDGAVTLSADQSCVASFLPARPTITTASPLPAGTVGTPYSQVLHAEGGQPPCTWAVVGGSLPSGMSLTPAGALTGTPVGAGAHSFRARVACANTGYDEKDFILTVTVQVVASPFTVTRSLQSPRGTLPTARNRVATAYDDANDRLIVSGGNSGGTLNDDVWVLQNATKGGALPLWQKLAPTGTLPPAREAHASGYDPATNRLAIHGGWPGLNDTWVLTNANGIGGAPAWLQLPSAPVVRAAPVSAYDASTNRLIVFSGLDADLSQTRAWLTDVWVLVDANGFGSPEWQQLQPTGTPPLARAWAASAYDPVSNRLIVHGGGAEDGSYLNDLWVLTNANGLGGTPEWVQLSASIGPLGRSGHRIGYNPLTKQAVVVGGETAGGASSDVWIITNADGTTGTPFWMPATPSGPDFNGSVAAAFGFASGTNRLVLALGAGTNGTRNDTWLLTLSGAIPAIGDFYRTSPSSGAGNQPLSVTLKWTAAAGATYYKYCYYDTTQSNPCTESTGAWVFTTNTTAVTGPLTANTEYAWIVQAGNGGQEKAANGGDWWLFRTQLAPTVGVTTFTSTIPEDASVGATLNVKRSRTWSAPLNVQIKFGGSAVKGTHYSAGPIVCDPSDADLCTVTVPGGGTSKTVPVTITAIPNVIAEGDRTITVTVLPGADYTVGRPSSATTTIIDDDLCEGESPDLVVASLAVPSTNTGAGQALSVTTGTLNQGTLATTQSCRPGSGTSTTAIYLSSDTAFSADDIQIGNAPVPVLGAGEASEVQTSVTIPPGTPGGTYYLLAQADGLFAVAENNESNNAATLQIKIGSDLVVSSLVLDKTLVKPGGVVMITPTVKNSGGGSSGASALRVYISEDFYFNQDTDLPLAKLDVPELGPGETYAAPLSVTIPEGTPGGMMYYLFAVADADKQVSEINEKNNNRLTFITVQ